MDKTKRKTGEGKITTKNGQNTSWHMINGTMSFALEESELSKIQGIYILIMEKIDNFVVC